MPFNGSGTFVSLPAPDFPALPGTTILASSFNANMNDVFINGLTKCITRDGQSPPTANLPMGGFKLTGMSNGTNDTDSAALGQTLALRGQVGVVDWDTRTSTGIFEATAAALLTPSTHFPPTSDLGQLVVLAQGAIINQLYVTLNYTYLRKKEGGVWTSWTFSVARRNYIVNSGCQFWQEATSLGSATGRRYAMDQCADESTGVTYTVSQQAFALGQTDVDPNAIYFHRSVVTNVAGAGNFHYVAYPMEYVSTLSARQVTVSFYAKANSTLPIAVELSQKFGTGGSPSAQVDTFLNKVTLSTTWARYQLTVTLPSVSGKTLGSASNDALELHLWTNAGSSFNSRTGTLGQQSGTFDFFGVKVEEGPGMTTYEYPLPAGELEACQRFFEVIDGTGQSTGGKAFTAINFQASTQPVCPLWYRTTKRAIPTISFPTGNAVRYVSNSGIYVGNNAVAFAPGADGFTLSCSSAPVASVGFMDNFGLMLINARLP